MEYRSRVVRLRTRANAAAIFQSLYGQSRHAYWLDSNLVDAGYSRFSFLGDDGGPLAKSVSFRIEEGAVRVDGELESRAGGNLFDFIESDLGKHHVFADEPLPFDFQGGYVGYFGYELMMLTEGVCGRSAALPDGHLLFSDRFVAVDHLEQEVYVVGLYLTDSSDTDMWLERTAETIRGLEPMVAPEKARLKPAEEIVPYLWHDREQYLENIAACKQKIRDGESYEICLTNRLRMQLKGEERPSPLAIYMRLRATNPAPYSCYIQTAEYSVLCSSPERFLKVDRASVVESRPIKGTMPRSRNAAEDQRNRNMLQQDKKFFSENLMIVDLLRNDLSKTCLAGSVEVPSLMHVKTYETVHQLFSTVRGKLKESATACVASCFPGGSMTGAPKRRTLEIINELEDAPRGIYSGAIGYLSLNGTADLNIVIRTIVLHQDVFEIGVGGAITHLSDPDEEFEEMLLKAKAPFSVVADYL